MKRIVLITGFTETLEFFSLQLADAFRQLGRDVFLWDMKRPLESREGLEAPEAPEESVLLTFNFIGIQGEGQFRFGEESIWEHYHMEVYCILVDSPMYYQPMLLAPVKRLHLIAIDGNHKRFLEMYYPEFGEVLFLPSGGTELIPREVGKPFGERKMDVIFTGNYVAPEHLEPHVRNLDPEMKEFLMETIRGFLAEPELVMETELERRARQAFGRLADMELCLALYHMVYVDLYVRSWYRGRIVASMAEAGLDVFATGKDWDLAPCKHPEKLHHTGQEITSAQCLEYLADSKVSLNVMPWFKAGAHDRIFNSMLQGCAVVTDSSEWLGGVLRDGEDCRVYSLREWEKASGMARELLEHPAEAAKIAEAGYRLASGGHTWAKRAEILNQVF